MKRQQEYQNRMIAQGLCSICGKRSLYSSTRCKRCYQKYASTKGVVNAGKNIRIRKERNKIILEIRDGLSSFKQNNPTSKNIGITNVLSKIANKYGVSVETIRRIYLRKINMVDNHKSAR